MPVDLTSHCKLILHDIVTTSEGIGRSAFAHANGQNFEVSQRLRRQLDNIRTSANAILEVLTEASFTDYTIDDGLKYWLFSGEPQTCLGKLEEMANMLKANVRPVRAPSLVSGEDKLTTAMAFFERHKSLFHSLITPNVWNRERLIHQPSGLEAQTSGINPLPISVEILSKNTVGHGSELITDQTSTTNHQKESYRRQLEEVLKWLVALNCADKHNYLHQLRQDGTCKWFPSTDMYTKWRRLGAQFLWLHGKAGCGKSVLVASTIEHLKGTLHYQEVVVFFYFDFQNERSRSPFEMLRSLLSQLCQHLLDQDIDPYTFGKKMLEEKARGSLSLNDLDKLCDLVSSAADRFVREPIVVIDALDECGDIKSLLHTLLRLWDEKKVRLLVTSRPHPEVTRRFTKLPSLSFEDVAMELAADIELHVMQETNRIHLKLASPEMKQELHAKLIQKAEGRFRWVQCQLDFLKRCTTAQDLRKALDNLPNELETTYERILDAIDERKLEGKLARRLLAWLTVALEPLRLVQILDTLSVDFSPPEKIESIGLIDMLSSLVSHHKETDVVSLSHFSVKEYFTARATLRMYQIIPYEAHAEAAQSCMRYISASMKRMLSRKNTPTLKSWPMLSYALSCGFDHLAHVDPESTVVLKALRYLGSDVRHHPSHWDHLCQLREEDLRLLYPPWPSSRHDFVFYILIAYSSIGLFQTFLSGHHPVKPRIRTNPLVYAADLRQTSHAIALSACDVDVNARGLAIDDTHHISPLQVAIDRDEDVLVGMLLQRGCLVTSELLSTCVCLPWCSARVLVKLVYTDEFEEWAHAIGDEKLLRGIFSSARPNAGDVRKADEDHVALAQRLREIGQDLSTNSRFGAELVERALYAAHTSMLEYLLPVDCPPPAWFLLTASTGDTSETVSIVRFLLGRGADINVTSECGDTVLHLAAMCPWEPRSLELTELFLDAGCNPRVPNLRGETPLAIAGERNYLSVSECLLSSSKFSHANALLDALHEHLAPLIIISLIDRGADVHAVTSEKKSVLHLVVAAYSEGMCLELVESLIQAGCDPSICDSMKRTVLDVAIERKYSSVAKLLLSHIVLLPPAILPFALQNYWPLSLVLNLIQRGADVHAVTSEKKSVLHLVVAAYNESICWVLVKRFIQAGCNPSICDFKGETVLAAAIKRRYISVAELLLSHIVPLPPAILPFILQHHWSPSLVLDLIHRGADVYATSSEGESILHLAIANYNEFACLKLVESFVGVGHDINIRNSMGKTALHAAVQRGYTLVVATLVLLYGAQLPPDILPFAIRQAERETARHLALAKSRCLKLVNCLVQSTHCNTEPCHSIWKTVLHSAIGRGHDSVVEALLSWNVQLPPADILTFALQHRSPPQLVRILIRNGADVHSTSLIGETAFHLAIANYSESACLELVQIFIEAGGNPGVCNSRGKTALHAAIERGYTGAVVEALLDSCL